MSGTSWIVGVANTFPGTIAVNIPTKYQGICILLLLLDVGTFRRRQHFFFFFFIIVTLLSSRSRRNKKSSKVEPRKSCGASRQLRPRRPPSTHWFFRWNKSAIQRKKRLWKVTVKKGGGKKKGKRTPTYLRRVTAVGDSPTFSGTKHLKLIWVNSHNPKRVTHSPTTMSHSRQFKQHLGIHGTEINNTKTIPAVFRQKWSKTG